MPEPKRLQLALWRISDTLCSLIAFLLAYELLGYVRDTLHPGSAMYEKVFGPLSPARGTGNALPALSELGWVFVVTTLAALLTLDARYDVKSFYDRTSFQVVLRLATAMIFALASTATMLYALHLAPYSRIFMFSYLTLLFLLALGYRIALRQRRRKRRELGLDMRSIVLAGSSVGIAKVIEQSAAALERDGAKIVGCLLLDDPPRADAPVPLVLGSLCELDQLLVHSPIDEVILVVPERESSWLGYALERCDYFRVSARIVHEQMLGVELQDLKLDADSSLPLPSIRLIPEEEQASNTILWKRLLDVVVAAVALMVLAPVFIVIAIAIKLTTPKLPIFYQWRVVGYRGRRFTGYKFTTMIKDADDRKHDLQSLNEMTGPVFKIRNDPRVTPLGKFLRKYSLNELPQFWSVLVGDMSLVGPRPAGPHELVRYETWQKRKLSVRPGITCYWQVRGRNAISNFDDWVRMDLEYIQNRSMWTDLTILFQTVGVVFRGTGS